MYVSYAHIRNYDYYIPLAIFVKSSVNFATTMKVIDIHL